MVFDISVDGSADPVAGRSYDANYYWLHDYQDWLMEQDYKQGLR